MIAEAFTEIYDLEIRRSLGGRQVTTLQEGELRITLPETASGGNHR